MKPRKKVDQTLTPDGNELVLYQHDSDYYMNINHHELMSSRRNESELELGRIACQQVAHLPSPEVLIGGLGMGYTLRASLDELPSTAEVLVAELLPAVIHWNEEVFGYLTDHPLKDKRVSLQNQDVLKVLKKSPDKFDAILMDIDNGPEAFSDSANDALYSDAGIQRMLQALKKSGGLYIWSADFRVKDFEDRLNRAGLKVEILKVKAHKNAKKRRHCIVAVTR